ncbi:hypothetical protein [Sorangium sp. So ce887]|uniref:hypothetical protein n=1 Tax=Sorangium sp. So ce887 TaxID=3133324 RepID=UPI003F5F5A8C
MRTFPSAMFPVAFSLLLGACAPQVDEPIPAEEVGEEAQALADCDPNLICKQVLTCVDGLVYPTGCGPDNCDEPIGKCCDPNMMCQMVLTCVDGLVYPTGCGPDNCDEPIGRCD